MHEFMLIISYSNAAIPRCHIEEKWWLRALVPVLARNLLLLLVIFRTCMAELPPPKLNSSRTSSFAVEVDRDCLVKVETALLTEPALVKFVEYLSKEGLAAGIRQIRAYTQIKEFEECAVGENATLEETKRRGAELWAKFRDPGSEVYLDDMAKAVESAMDISLRSRDEPVDKHLFDQLYGLIINSLQRMFVEFRTSEQCRRLSIDLERKSLLSEKLRRASLV